MSGTQADSERPPMIGVAGIDNDAMGRREATDALTSRASVQSWGVAWGAAFRRGGAGVYLLALAAVALLASLPFWGA